MIYCTECVYPANAKPGILFDNDGVCTGCRGFRVRTTERHKVDWDARRLDLIATLSIYATEQRRKGNPYDCIIPVSGGKDSHYQAHVVKREFGFNPLLVSYNHGFNTALGLANLANLVEMLDCSLLRFSTPLPTAIRLAKHMLRECGDVTWHYHAGIMSWPAQVAVQHDVPLMIWGEEGFSELTGMFKLEDNIEFTKRKRLDVSMRGFDPDDMVKEGPFTRYELAPFFYPSDEDIERVGLRGIYLSNYIPWDAREQTEFVIRELGFETANERERTFNIHAKTDCLHANGLHDYLKYLKFGYGRATDDASNEIRHGRMTRDEGIDMVLKYDHVRPSDMDVFLEAAEMSERELLETIEPMRDLEIWERVGTEWYTRDNVGNHRGQPEPPKWHPFVPSPRRDRRGYVTL